MIKEPTQNQGIGKCHITGGEGKPDGLANERTMLSTTACPIKHLTHLNVKSEICRRRGGLRYQQELTGASGLRRGQPRRDKCRYVLSLSLNPVGFEVHVAHLHIG